MTPEKKRLFFETLEKQGVSSSETIDNVSAIVTDIDGLNDLSPGETRQLFAEYVTYIRKKERDSAREREQRSREGFRDFLEDWIENDMSPDITFRQVASVCCKMDFWPNLSVDELDDIFQDTIEEYNRRGRNKLRDKVYDLQRDLYRAFEKADPPLRPGHDRWSEVVQRFEKLECFAKLDNLDRFQVFEDFMKEEIQKYRDDQRRRERRTARKNRESFVSLLEEYKDEIAHSPGEVKWSDFVSQIKDRSEYRNLIGTKHSSQPYDLFAEMRSKWKRQDDEVREIISGGTSIHNSSES